MSWLLLSEVFTRLSRDLRALGVPWALVGGLAVSARAEPRMTRDIDVALTITGDQEAEQIVHRLRDRGYLDGDSMFHRETGRLSTVRLQQRDDESGTCCDLLFAMSGIEGEVVAAAEPLEVLPGLVSPVATRGHLLALKVLALRPDRPQERGQDLTDIRALLRVADDDELERARQALELISRRGYDRGKDLEATFREQLRQFRRSSGDGPP